MTRCRTKKTKIPTKEMYKTLHEKLEYREGKLYWKVVPNCNKRFLNQEAGSPNVRKQYKSISIMGEVIKVHRAIFLMFHGYLPEQIDHINRDRLDNRIENLREATSLQNNFNHNINKNNTSGFPTLYWRENRNHWVIRIRQQGHRYYGGSFKDKNEAIIACAALLEKLRGEYSSANDLLKTIVPEASSPSSPD